MLGISQSTVSRRERDRAKKSSEANNHLCRYAELMSSQPKIDRDKVLNSLSEVWNMSEAHADALSKIVDAVVELCYVEGNQEK